MNTMVVVVSAGQEYSNMQITSQSLLKRTLDALSETDALIAKELRYLPHLQKPDYLASLEKHQAKLVAAIRDYYNTPLPATFIGPPNPHRGGA